MVDEVKERGGTVFFSSHHLDEVERIADRVGAIREGRMVAVDTVAGSSRGRPPDRGGLRGAGRRPRVQRASAACREVRSSGRRLHMVVAGPIDPVLKAIARHSVASLSAPEPKVEEIFLGLYRGERPRSASHAA